MLRNPVPCGCAAIGGCGPLKDLVDGYMQAQPVMNGNHAYGESCMYRFCACEARLRATSLAGSDPSAAGLSILVPILVSQIEQFRRSCPGRRDLSLGYPQEIQQRRGACHG